MENKNKLPEDFIRPWQPEDGGYLCLPLARNIPEPKHKDWKQVTCPICGSECWESDNAREAMAKGAKGLCTMCALKQGINGAKGS